MEGLRGVPDHLDKLLKEGFIQPEVYNMCLVSLAHRHICVDHDPEQALIALNRVPPAYFLEVLPGQMREDDAFAKAAVELGLTTGLDTHVVNMRKAEA